MAALREEDADGGYGLDRLAIRSALRRAVGEVQDHMGRAIGEEGEAIGASLSFSISDSLSEDRLMMGSVRSMTGSETPPSSGGTAVSLERWRQRALLRDFHHFLWLVG